MRIPFPCPPRPLQHLVLLILLIITKNLRRWLATEWTEASLEASTHNRNARAASIINHQGRRCAPKRKGQRIKPSGISPFRTQKEEKIKILETERKIVGTRKFCTTEMRKEEWQGGQELQKSWLRSKKRLLDLGIWKPSESNVYRGWWYKPDFSKPGPKNM